MKRRRCGIYCIQNIINKKRYFGQSMDICERFRKHKESLRRNNKKYGNYHLQQAWDKYGEKNFRFQEILLLPKIGFILDIFEIFFIWIFRSNNPERGYNMTTGGGVVMRGRKHSEKTKMLMSSIRKGIPKSLETRAKMAKAQRKLFDSGYVRKVSKKTMEKHKKENLKQETIEKMKRNNSSSGNPNFGKKSKTATSKYFGVFWDKNKNKWTLNLRTNIKIFRKRFNSEIEAAKEYDKIVKEFNLPNPLNFGLDKSELL